MAVPVARKKPKLPTAKQVFDRIRWDEGFDERCFSVGYETHDGEIEQVAFVEFVAGGEIPWHRIRFFRRGRTIVWERRTRTNRLDELRRAKKPAPPRTPR